MPDQITVNASGFDSAKTGLKNSYEALMSEKDTIQQMFGELQGAWLGASAESFFEMVEVVASEQSACILALSQLSSDVDQAQAEFEAQDAACREGIEKLTR